MILVLVNGFFFLQDMLRGYYVVFWVLLADFTSVGGILLGGILLCFL